MPNDQLQIKYTWHCCNRRLEFSRTLLMGILNVTPDSFSDGGQFNSIESAVKRAIEMQEQGADIIDIGGESTRPGAEPVTIEQELQRVIPIIRELSRELSIPISIDTYKSRVALEAVQAGAEIINDISGGHFDPEMLSAIAETQAGCVLMHIKGSPRNMQKDPYYDDVVEEIKQYFYKSLKRAFQAGVQKEQIVLDPGVGFGKRLQDNYVITHELNAFVNMGYPVLYAPSRKSFIGKVLNLPPEERVEGTIAAGTAAILNGAHIIRVHDILQFKRAATIADLICKRSEIKA